MRRGRRDEEGVEVAEQWESSDSAGRVEDGVREGGRGGCAAKAASVRNDESREGV